MSNKKNTKSGGLTSIPGGKSGSTPSGTGGNKNGNRRGGGGGNGRDGGNDGNKPTSNGNVVDFTSVRAQRSMDNRRTFERFFMQHLVDVYCEINGAKEMLPVEMVEISESGCSFRVRAEKVELLPRDTTGAILPLQIRLYFSKDSYLRIGMSVVNSTRDIAANGQTTRFGCRVDETFASTEAYRQFARFMQLFANHAARDTKHASAY
jgi:hypothetical protein